MINFNHVFSLLENSNCRKKTVSMVTRCRGGGEVDELTGMSERAPSGHRAPRTHARTHAYTAVGPQFNLLTPVWRICSGGSGLQDLLWRICSGGSSPAPVDERASIKKHARLCFRWTLSQCKCVQELPVVEY